MRPKTDKEIEIMREGGRMLASVLDMLEREIKSGMSTKELSNMAAKEIKALGGQASFLNHEGFPEAMTVSVNEQIVHGIPSNNHKIADGDVVGLDFGVTYKGLITDGAKTVFVGSNQSTDIKRLMEGTKRSLNAGIDAVHGDGTRVGNISSAVQVILDQNKLGIIRDLVGHGVGDKIHEAPNIPNYGVSGTGPKLSTGMTICIEPMASLGDWHIDIDKDGWTAVMHDGSLSAHFEHTIVITEKSAEILTTL